MKPASSRREVKGAAIGALLAFLVLGVTLAVYSTKLNPGVPIMLGGLLACSGALFRIWKGAGPCYHPGLDCGFALLFWAALCHQFGCLDLYLGEKALATFAGAIAFLLVPQLFVGSGRALRSGLYLLTGLVVVACCAAWPPVMAGKVTPIRGTFVNPDTFSVLPMFAVVMVLGVIGDVPRKWRLPGYGLLLFLLASLWATGCRAAILALFAATLTFFALVLIKRKERFPELVAVLAFPLLLALFAMPFLSPGSQLMTKLSRSLAPDALTEHHVRLEVASRGWRAVAARPVWGAGLGCFGLSYQAVRPKGHDDDYINIAHNDHIEIAVELGLLGLVLWGALLYFALSNSFRGLSRGSSALPSAALFAAVVAFIVYSLFNFIMAERPAQWLSFCVLGMALSCPGREGSRTEPFWLRVVFSLGLGVLGLWAMSFGYRALYAQYYVGQSRQHEQVLLVERAYAELSRAIEYQPHRVELRHRMDELLRKRSLFRGASAIDERRQNLEEALASSPRDVPTMLRMVEVLLAAGEGQGAEDLLEQGAKFAPYHSLLDRKRVSVSIRRGDFAKAARVFEPYLTSGVFRQEEVVAIILAAELTNPGSGARLFEEWFREPARGEALDKLLLLAQQTAVGGKHWEVARRLAELSLQLKPEDLCRKTRLAAVFGQTEGPVSEFETLKRMVKETGEKSGPCFDEMVDRWSSLGFELHKSTVVEQRLKEILKAGSRSESVRIRLADAYLHLQREDQALAALREGLTERVSPRLLIKMAEVYEEMGSYDLARNYYKDALRLDSSNAALTTKLKELDGR